MPSIWAACDKRMQPLGEGILIGRGRGRNDGDGITSIVIAR